MTVPDFLYLVFIAAALLVDHFMVWPRFVEFAAIDPAQARRTIWLSWLGMFWLMAAFGTGLWFSTQRHWSSIGFDLPSGWRLWLSFGLLVAVSALYASTFRKLGHIGPARKAALRARFGLYERILPHNRSELFYFIGLSLTAGICEELVFRGYLVGLLQPIAGPWGAVLVSCVVFALGHAYQGLAGVLKSGIAGIVFMALILVFRSLIPAILLHALIDAGQGVVAWLILRVSLPASAEHDLGAVQQAQSQGRS